MEPDDVELFLRTNVLGLMSDVHEACDLRLAQMRTGTRFTEMSALEVKIFKLLRGRQRTTSDLATATCATQTTVLRAARGLARSGIIELESIADKPGERMLTLTEAGETLRHQGAEQIWKVEREMARAVGRAELENLRLILSRLNAAGFTPETGSSRLRRRKDH